LPSQSLILYGHITGAPDLLMKKLFLAMVGVSISFAGSAMALPFQPNPDSFASWLNSKSATWKDGKVRRFSNLSECKLFAPQRYACHFGYVKVTSPMGSQLCEIQLISGYSTRAIEYTTDGVEIGSTYPCKNL
jgi:hypothetical protein